MRILVDYDNLDEIIQRRGVEHLIWLILQTLDPSYLDPSETVSMRLYGGWYLGDELSHNAQQLVVQIDDLFPRVIEIGTGPGTKAIRVNTELARSLLIEPGRALFHTYRPRGFPGGIQCSPPPFSGCILLDNCPLEVLYLVISDRACTTEGCEVKTKDILTRPEQKLVDTMLTTDLIYLCTEEEQVGIVSSDDDLWPGVKMALYKGVIVHHLHSRKGQTIPDYYKSPTPRNYNEYNLI